jgi:hypothetical protein
MDPLAVVLAVAFTVLAIASVIAHREYEAAYARRHRDVAPLMAPLVRRDSDADVEWFRRRDLWLTAGTAVTAIAFVLFVNAT